ncbi:MAG: cytochrome-c oxidase, cbb3-type subunit III [Polaromonas sp.]|nr:cytochrome-c oxidase, cbb3-type subunit III [Polaromonas sp.]
MSDFTSDFWHLFVGGLTFVSIIACLILLWIAGTTKAATHADNTTGHVWDGDLAEINNPLPKWWVYLFVITCIFGLVYGALYPMFGKFQGALGWSSQGQHAAEVKKVEASIAPLFARFSGMTPEQQMADAEAMAVGERLFMNYCAQCHGSDARGAKSFPNLADGDWLGGTDHAYIRGVIANGRTGVMPPMAAAVGGPEDVRNVSHYVLSLSGSPHDSVRASQGKEKFASCAACHGAEGKGMHALGAPNLTDSIWLHGWGEEAIIRSINEGFNNHMPGQSALLNDAQVNVLASYVLGLSGKQGN